MSGLPSFPAGPGPAPATPAYLSERGFALRHAVDADLPRLLQLYADTRADELAGVPWPPDFKQTFLDQQFQFQHRHFLAEHPTADFLVIEREGRIEGRYYLLRDAPEHHIVDICLISAHRGRGLGRALIEASQQEARAQGRGMALQVLVNNVGARRLYERLGFGAVAEASTDSHLFMRWPG
ncbi:GNAT family N-acetyltransferase [Arenimonas terrae]|jgi:ribosomal protein S18 acetylase RimI-like enzyme|uniref:GNAT family N-acetyltransferase n=1 Tax=Arenimonas terrae TaxID=2546226 RepID=A0A5C4RNP7_9GAMM|nr:GNAT family N-acetyltransferase [Arenimonas terrae]TNJ32876.1 GNAT family N-acetyltransferase [Arenimonas terrae]